tara:strand:- start:221 stop:574 length:354 start_codon:yes stop_codon:yes gene_type:complete
MILNKMNTQNPYQIILEHLDSDYVSENELFISLNDGFGGCSYGILDTYNHTITELGIECIQNSGKVSVLSDYSKLALLIDIDQGRLKIYDNLPSISELYNIEINYINNPILIKNKWQ